MGPHEPVTRPSIRRPTSGACDAHRHRDALDDVERLAPIRHQGNAAPFPALREARRLLDAEAQSVNDEERIAYHAELLALETPELRKIVMTGRTLLKLNQRQHGARRGLLVTGEPTTGKSTAITQLGRAVELAYRRLRPYRDDAAPVVYLTMPPQATPKSLSIEILKFLGAPYLSRDSQIELTRQACISVVRSSYRTDHRR